VSELLLRTLMVGGAAVLVELPVAVLLGRWLARREFRGKALVQTLLVLPMFLPPVAVGLFLLLALGPRGPFGGALLFEPAAAALAAAVIGFPLLLRHAQEAFAAVPVRLLQVGATLGASRWRLFLEVELPLARRGLAVGALLAFARGISEYGATAVVAGVIPGRTETLATGLMRRLAQGDDGGALALAGLSVVLGLAAVLLSEALVRRGGHR
jgi:molybdate transport system permease protein